MAEGRGEERRESIGDFWARRRRRRRQLMRNKGMIRLKKDFVKREGRTGEEGVPQRNQEI